ncbi:MAG: response regulator [Proteobacteria bacterium]|nr:response regulator [Pseudomonadota bacterium]
MDRDQFKIMVVNDKLELRNIVRNYLKNEGYTNLTISENSRSALKRARESLPDLILADADLPEMGGLDLLKAVRQDAKLAEVAFVIISGDTSQQFVARAAEFRVSGFLLKPFSNQTLVDKVGLIHDSLIHPSEGATLYQEANQLLQNGSAEAALEKYEQALAATRKGMAAIHYKIGRVHEVMDQEQEAEVDYERALHMSRMYVDAYDALGGLNLKWEKPDKALEYLNKSSEISPLNADRQLKLGEALLGAGQFEAAEKAFKLSLQLDPAQTHIFNRLGITLRRQGKLEEAGQFFLRATEVTQDDENLFFNLSRVYLDQGHKESAVLYLEKALALKPDFEEARDLIQEIRSV